MKSKLFWAAPLAALAVSAAAPQIAAARSPVQPDTPETKTQRSCFWARNANGFAAADEKTVNIRVGVRDVYQFEMLGRCTDIDWSQKIALVSRGSSSICTGLDAEIVTASPIGPQRCPVRAVRKLTPDEVAALPSRARP
ncbi:DUF6491 family protein [Phenylobacterium sp.]|uniref:DUF6491 family protein n=1 Tax=Phenylobacterium sp. TaxID=1871053 RepID=UPI002BEDBEE7|nr:DUF6491 family protein [Phenylobacterium sp.]HVI32211.1 DUF6491 family protein [Phenylobacterium sp.]